MRQQLSAYLNSSIITIIYVVVFLAPFLVTNLTTEFYETPKLILLSGAVLLLLVLWSFTWVIQGKVTFTRTPLDLPILLFLVVVLVSAFFSDSRYVSIFGNFPRVHGSLIAWISYILFYFVLSSNLKTHRQVKGLFYILLLSSFIVSIITILSYFKVYLPLSFTQSNSFTPSGSPFSTNALLILLLPFTLLSVMKPNKFMPRWLGMVLGPIFLLAIVLTGSNLTLVVAGIVILLVVLVERSYLKLGGKGGVENMIYNNAGERGAAKGEMEQDIKEVSGFVSSYMPWIAIAVPVLCLALIVLSYLNLGKANPIYKARQDFQPFREIQLPLSPTWKVSASAFRDSPFLGTGPSTFLFNFTAYKPVQLNTTTFWNVRFDQGFNEFLQVFGTLGILGLLSLIFLCVMVLGTAWRRVSRKLTNNNAVFAASLAYSSVAFILLLLIHVSTVVSIVGGLVILAMLMAIHRSETDQVEELAIGIKASKFTDSNLIVGDILPVIVFIPVLLFVVWAGFNGVNVVRGDFYHRMALNAANTRALDTYNNLVLAEKYNPYIDLYRTDLAQTNFALANAIASNKGPNEASPGGSLTDQDKQNIQTLLQQSINEGRAATTLSPRSAQNWEILASIYRQITGVAKNALNFALDSYGRAIDKDPLNPVLRLNVGGLYYSVKNYELAVRFFTDAVTLKPDYANGYYNLAVALRDKGDLTTAQSVAERLVGLVDPKSGDYKVATELLANLKSQTATASADQSQLAPTASQNSPLQQENLPKVVDLPQDETLSTPSAITKPSPSPKASVSPSPSASPEASANP